MRTIADAYDDVAKFIQYQVAKFREANGGEYEEALSDANMAFMKAYGGFDAAKGDFGARVQYMVKMALTDAMRARLQRAMILKRTEIDLGFVPDRRHWCFSLFVEGLSLDAMEAVIAGLEAAEQLPRSDMIRKATKKALRALGWDGERIGAAFAEVREALEG